MMACVAWMARTSRIFRSILKELEIPYVELGEEIKDLQARVAFCEGIKEWNEQSSLSIF
jgi:hypothetical protein